MFFYDMPTGAVKCMKGTGETMGFIESQKEIFYFVPRSYSQFSANDLQAITDKLDILNEGMRYEI